MTTKADKFEIDKSIWSQEDFKEMGWHDATIYGLTFEKKESAWTADLILDIDYIFKWGQPIPPSTNFTFWVAPCTLIFTEVFALQMELNTEDYSIQGIEIADLHLLKTENHNSGAITYHWNIELQNGLIKFHSNGYTQIVRKKPVHIAGQSLSMDERGGINFSQIPY